MDLISSMKDRIKNSGSSRKEIFYVGADSKRRIRFLQELDTGYEFKFHSHWNRGVNALCGDHYNVDCPYCADTDEDMKEVTHHAVAVQLHGEPRVEFELTAQVAHHRLEEAVDGLHAEAAVVVNQGGKGLRCTLAYLLLAHFRG